MADTFGKARLELTVDLEKFKADLNQALSMSNSVINDLKSGMSIDAGKLDFSALKTSLESIDKTAKSTSEEIHTLGEKGTDSISKLMKFQLVQGTLDGVKQAFMSVKESVMDSTQEYAASELSVEKLRGGLDRLGSGDYFSRLLQQSEELHKITPFDDDDITNMQAMLTTFGATGDQIEALTPKMLDVASAFAQGSDTGMSLTQTAIMIGKATGADMVAAMQRVGVIMSDTQKAMFEAASGMDRINILSQILTQNSNITAEAFGKTLAGQIKISDNAFKDMKETIGKAFAPVVREALAIVQQVSDLFQKLPPDLQAAAGALIVVTAAATALIPVLVALDVELAGIPLIIGAVVAGIGVLYEVLTNMEAIESFVTELVGGEDVINEFKEVVSELWDELKDLWDVVSNELSVAFEDIKEQAIDVWNSFTDLFGGSENLLSILKTMGKDGLLYIKDIILTVIDAMSRIIRTISDTVESNNKWLGSTNKAGEGLSSLKILVDGAVNGITIMIEVVSRATQVMFGLYNALVGLGGLNVYDLIFNKAKFDQNLDKFKLGIEQVKDAFSKSVKDKSGIEILPVYGPTLDHPIPGQIKEEKKTGESPSGKTKGSGSEKTTDPYKEENESLKNLIADFEHLLKLKDDEIKRGEATLADRNEIVDSYLKELNLVQEGLQNKDNQTKVSEKISELMTSQFEQIKKSGEEQKKLVDDVDKFIDKRTEKTLQGAAKETSEIEIAYRTMYDKIDKASIEISEKEMLRKQLDIKKEEELKLSAKKFDDQLNTELKTAMMKNSEETYNLEIFNINNKYNKEKERILQTYKDGDQRSLLLHQNELSRIKELERVHTEGQLNILNLINSGFGASANSIKTEFKNVWVEVFGEAHSLFQIFIQEVYNALIELAATSLFKFLLNTLSGGLFGGTESAGRAFATGTSWTGDGREDELAGFVHHREAVMNSLGAQYPFNRALVGLANQGYDLSKFLPTETTFSLPSVQMPDLPAASSSRNITINFDFSNMSLPIQTLDINSAEFDKTIDEQLVPAFSEALHRIGKTVLDNQISK
jgi:hypothetical protein